MYAQDAVNKLTEHFLGKDWYITDPVTNYDANDIIVKEITLKYPRKYLKVIDFIRFIVG